MVKNKGTIEPIDDDFDKVADIIANPCTQKPSKNNTLLPIPSKNPGAPEQRQLEK